MTNQEMRREVERLLLRREEYARLGLELPPDERMLLKRLLYRLGLTKGVAMSRPKRLSRGDELGFMRAIHDDPREKTNHLVYADWLQDHGHDAAADLIRNAMTAAGPAYFRHMAPTGRTITQRDIESDSAPYHLAVHHPVRGRVQIQVIPKVTVGQVTDDPTTDITHNRPVALYGREMPYADAHEFASRLPEDMGSQLRGVLKDTYKIPPPRPTTMSRRPRPRLYAKIDHDVPAHVLIHGFPLEHALRHVANDPKAAPHTRQIAKHVLQHGEGLYALHDALQEEDHPILKAGYNFLSAAAGTELDRHTHTALAEEADRRRKELDVPAREDDRTSGPYSPASYANTIHLALHGYGDPKLQEAAKRVMSRVKSLSGEDDQDKIRKSIARHAQRYHMAVNEGIYSKAKAIHQEESTKPVPPSSGTGSDILRHDREMSTRYRRPRPRRYSGSGPGGAYTHGDFAQKILENPRERTSSHAYADWLEENDKPTVAGFVRQAVDNHGQAFYHRQADFPHLTAPGQMSVNRIGDVDAKGLPVHHLSLRIHTGVPGREILSYNLFHHPKESAKQMLNNLADEGVRQEVETPRRASRKFARTPTKPTPPPYEPPNFPLEASREAHRITHSWGHGHPWHYRADEAMYHAEQGKSREAAELHDIIAARHDHEGREMERFPDLLDYHTRAAAAHRLAAKLHRGEGVAPEQDTRPNEMLPEDYYAMRRKRYAKSVGGDFIDSLRRIRSSNQVALHKTADSVSRKLGLRPTKVMDALHDTPDGATPGIAQAVYGNARPEDVHAAAAWIGLTGNLPGVAVFHNKPDGPDTLYKMHQAGSGLDIRQRLDRHGLTNRILIPEKNGFQILVPDRGSVLGNNVKSYSKAQGLPLETTRGHLATVGSQDQARAREMFRDRITSQEQGPQPQPTPPPVQNSRAAARAKIMKSED